MLSPLAVERSMLHRGSADGRHPAKAEVSCMLDRDYARGYGGVASMEAPLLLSRVCFLTIFAVLMTAVGAAIPWALGVQGSIWMLIGFIGSMVMLFVCNAV